MEMERGEPNTHEPARGTSSFFARALGFLDLERSVMVMTAAGSLQAVVSTQA